MGFGALGSRSLSLSQETNAPWRLAVACEQNTLPPSHVLAGLECAWIWAAPTAPVDMRRLSARLGASRLDKLSQTVQCGRRDRLAQQLLECREIFQPLDPLSEPGRDCPG